MLQSEFEELTGQKVSPDEYAKIERVYTAAPDAWKKEDFCRAYKLADYNARALFYDLTELIEVLKEKLKNTEYRLKEELNRTCHQVTEIEKINLHNKQLTENTWKLKRDCSLLNGVRRDLAKALLKAGYEDEVITIIGQPLTEALKCTEGFELNDKDRKFIANVILI